MTRECDCGLALLDLRSRIDEITKRTVSLEELSISSQELITRDIKTILQEDMPRIRVYCKIDTRPEEEAMRTVRDIIPSINTSGGRRIINDSITTSLQSIRELLEDCTRK